MTNGGRPLRAATQRDRHRRAFFYEGKTQARTEDYDAGGNLLTPAAKPEVRRATPVRCPRRPGIHACLPIRGFSESPFS